MTLQKRNEKGLFENITYLYREDGLGIDWRKMLKPEHLAINRQYETELKTKFNTDDINTVDKTQLEDRYLMILLAGIKYLAKLRGYYEIDNKVTHVTDFKAVANCAITWIPNEETIDAQTFSDSASATSQNTQGFGSAYLESIACNRAFVRAVRNYLEINIVGADELKDQKEALKQESGLKTDSPVKIVRQKLVDKGIKTLEQLQEFAGKHKDKFSTNPAEWTKLEELDSTDLFTILSLLKSS